MVKVCPSSQFYHNFEFPLPSFLSPSLSRPPLSPHSLALSNPSGTASGPLVAGDLSISPGPGVLNHHPAPHVPLPLGAMSSAISSRLMFLSPSARPFYPSSYGKKRAEIPFLMPHFFGKNALPVPVDGQISAPLAFFNLPLAALDQAAQPQLVDVVGLTAVARLGWRQPREQELLGENSQMSSIDFLHTGSAVSTGLGLSLENRCHGGGGGAGAGNSSGDSSLLLLPMLDDDISREVPCLDADMDRFIKARVSQESNI